MKTISLYVVLVFLTCTRLAAQTKAIQYGFKAGIGSVGFNRTPGQDILIDDPEKARVGFSAGVFASLNIDRISIQPGVFLVSRGAKTTDEIVSGDIVYSGYGSWRLYYLQVPVNLVYHIPVSGGSIYLGGGPYIATALSGKFNNKTLDGQTPGPTYDNAFDQKAKFGSGTFDNFKRIDYGVNAIAGFRFNSGLLINLGYEAGLANIQNDHYYYASTKNSGANISVGYLF